MSNTPPATSVDGFLSRRISGDIRAYRVDAERIAELAARIAANPPSPGSSMSGDVARLSQYVIDLLRSAARIEANMEAVQLVQADKRS